jgi:signal transduction histidine kinase
MSATTSGVPFALPLALNRSLLFVLVVLGCATAVAEYAITITIDEQAPMVEAVLVVWITVLYVLCGLVAWARRPESRFGPLMVIAGFGPLFSRLSEVDQGLAQTLGEVCRMLPVLLFLHVFLAYPSGRLTRRSERVVVAVGYSTVVVSGVLGMMLGPSEHNSVIAVVDWPLPADALLATAKLMTAVVTLAGLTLLFARAHASGRALRPLVRVCLASALVALAVGIPLKTFGSPGVTPLGKWVAFALIGIAPVLFLVGFLRTRLAQSAVGDLMLELRAGHGVADLRESVARALRDPSLELVYWLPEFDSYAGSDGRPAVLPERAGTTVTTVVDSKGARVAALLHDPALLDEPELLEAVTATAGIALENGRLHAELRARLEELRGSRGRIVDAGQAERKRLERDLHDGAQQRLIALSLELGLLQERLDGDAESKKRLTQARGEIATSLDELRDVAHGIHPAVVSGHGLEVALEELVARGAVPVRLDVELSARLPERLEVAAFYLVSESLANIAKHAEATSASVQVRHSGGQVVVEVTDDGVGGAQTERGSGLRGLADRVEAIEGRLRIWSPPGGGTRLRAELPCE